MKPMNGASVCLSAKLKNAAEKRMILITRLNGYKAICEMEQWGTIGVGKQTEKRRKALGGWPIGGVGGLGGVGVAV
jgi:hypothetical protein